MADDLVIDWMALDYPEQRTFNETYGFSGAQGNVHVEALLLKPRNRPSKTLFFFMHPSTSMDVLPVPRSLVALGCHVLCARNRYFRNDSALIFEKVIIDVGEWMRYAREVLGYEKVVIVGWSGGGPLSVFYQSQAEKPTITHTPAGDAVDIVNAGLIPADAVIFQAGSVSRSRILLEALDPSVRNELDPDDRDPRWDLYDPSNPVQPPYSADFVAEYRAEQLVRMRRITDWVKSSLANLKERGGKEVERGFIVHRTMADPRYIDPMVDPNDRKPQTFLTAVPETVNTGPTGFARFTTLRSWLSQWSIDDSRADAAVGAATVSVPFLAIENGGDDGAPPSHMHEVYEACASTDKDYVLIKGANHYYAGQPELLAQTSTITRDFLAARNLLDV
ncbi:MAG: alpha/beta hydrolase [Pseudonocardiales bacterium]|nr:alpha/beta hydrolase [Pseudonocardiales bacterium]